MKTIFLVIAFSALAAAVPEWKDWHVTYGYDGPTNTSFYPIPLNEAEAKSQNWVAVDTAGPLKVTCYCLPDDPRYCMLYDSKGKVAGFQVGVLDSDVAGIAPSYVMSNIAMYTLQTMFGIKVWTAQCYVIDPAIIQAGGSSNTDGTFGSGGVWLKNGDNYIQVSKNETIMAATTSYTREICVNKMGVHYYYNISKSMTCQDFKPWFLLYDNNGNLLGVGLQGFGKYSTLKRKWFEDIPPAAIADAKSNFPDCLTKLADQNGLISVHTYWTPQPWTFTCPPSVV